MTTRFEPLFEIQLKHNFYQDDRCPDFQLLPTPACQQMMQKLGLLFRSNQYGAFVLYKFMEGETPLIQSLEAPVALSFLLSLKNPNLLNYTDLPLQSGRVQYYFSNESKQAGSEGNIRINEADFAGLADVMPFVGTHFPVEVNAVGDKKVKVELSNQSGKVLVDQVVEDQQYFHLHLGAQDPGQYRISVADQPPFRVYYEPAVHDQHFGLIELQINPKDQRLFDKEKSCVFDICFKSRSTVWRYYIVNQRSEQMKTFKIVDKTSAVQFTEGEEVLMPDGNKAMRFASIVDAVKQQGIELKERYNGHFQLELYGEVQQLGGRRSKKTMILPNANAQQVRIEQSNEGFQAFSDLYIYV
ncbi:MAG: hypothetical protein AAF985_06685 [Bacteroidota bacterium]